MWCDWADLHDFASTWEKQLAIYRNLEAITANIDGFNREAALCRSSGRQSTVMDDMSDKATKWRDMNRRMRRHFVAANGFVRNRT